MKLGAAPQGAVIICMANAPIDANGRQGATGLLNTDGSTVTPVKANASTHRMLSFEGVSGSDNGGTKAGIDANSRQTMFASSSANDGSLVALYVDSGGCLLTKQT